MVMAFFLTHFSYYDLMGLKRVDIYYKAESPVAKISKLIVINVIAFKTT